MSFEISMKDFLIVNVVHRESHLHKPGDDLMFWEQGAELFLFGYFMKHVASLTIIHDDA